MQVIGAVISLDRKVTGISDAVSSAHSRTNRGWSANAGLLPRLRGRS